MILNLDPYFKPVKGAEVNFESFFFSGGEPHIRITSTLNQEEEVTITHRLKSFNDFGLLLLAIDALKRMGVEKINTFIPYFPAARQDRVMTPGESLSVKVYADILNAQNLNKITVYDPHSEVTPALLNTCEVITNLNFIKEVIQTINEDVYLVSPDGGALKKIYKLASALQDYEVIECSKQRDVKTRKLSGFKVYADDLKGKACLLVDDICDGGGTFIGLAKELKAKNAGKLYLAISHGIFSRGIADLKEHFEEVFSTNSFGVDVGQKIVEIKI